MGLDEWTELCLRDERAAFESLRTNMSYGEFCAAYPDNDGKVNCRRALLLTHKLDKLRGGIELAVQKNSKPVVDVLLKENAFKEFLAFMHLIRQIQNTGGQQSRLQTLHQVYAENKLKGHNFSQDDLNLYLPLISYFNSDEVFKNFFDILDGSKIFSRLQLDGNFRKEAFYERAFDSLEVLGVVKGAARVFPLALDHSSNENNSVLAKELKGKLSSICHGYENEIMFYWSNFSEWTFDNVVLQLNGSDLSDRNYLDNMVDCCITHGKAWEAIILYSVDPAVHIWSAHMRMNDLSFNRIAEPLGISIMIEGAGHTSSEPQNEKRYLILEGFPANQDYYELIKTLKNPQKPYGGKVLSKAEEYMAEIESLMSPRWQSASQYGEKHAFWQVSSPPLSLPEAMYVMALKTAQRFKIPYLFVNASHSGRQKSVEDLVRSAASMSSLPRGEVWKMSRHREFELLKDSQTNSPLASFEIDGQKFEYTHFLQKPQLKGSLVQTLRSDSSWSGEGYFDTWYGWNKFIMDTYPKWSEELKKQHPYAEFVAKRGKDPQWNLGIGYCKGFEVDVEKECKRLGIS